MLWWPLLPLIITIQFYAVFGSATRFYMSVERDAILGVHANRHGWHLIDHAAANPGSGTGHALRQVVFPDLVAVADRYGITIWTTAANQRLARHYIEDLPGLIDVGPAPHGKTTTPSPAADISAFTTSHEGHATSRDPLSPPGVTAEEHQPTRATTAPWVTPLQA